MSKDNTCPNCRHKRMVTGIYETLCYVHGSGQQEDKPNYAAYICGGVHCKCLEGRKGGCTNYHSGDHTCPASTPTDSKPEKPDQLTIAVEGIVDDIVTHAYHHPPVPKEFYRARIKALLATEYDRGKVDGAKALAEFVNDRLDNSGVDNFEARSLMREFLTKLKSKGEVKSE